MDNQALVNFDPKKFIELLLKLDARAKGHEVEVEVRECKGVLRGKRYEKVY